MERLKSSEPSCVSMKSDRSMDPIVNFSRRTDSWFRPNPPESSCVSMKSDRSMDPIVNFNGHTDPGFRPNPPESSCVSMKSDRSMDPIVNFSRRTDSWFSSVQMERLKSSESSCVSIKSDRSMDPIVNFSRRTDSWFRPNPPESSCVSMKSDRSMDPIVNFNGHTDPGFRPNPPESSCVSMKSDQSMDPPSNFSGHTDPGFSSDPQHAKFLKKFKSNLRKKFECLYEGTAKQGNPTLLNEIYTELYITESDCGEINNEHEVRQIETQSSRAATEDTPIKCNDIFTPLPGQDKPIRTVLTKGVAGIGKTVSVQKFILDWAEGKENQDVQLIFPLPFRELNLMKDKILSLLDLLRVFFPETKEMKPFSDEYKVVFVFDGLDECRLSQNFNVKLCNISESASVDVLLTNLIVGNLLPSALIWITSRPAAADLVPSECVHRVTEVRGFNEPQKEEYFRKRISKKCLSNRIITHLKSSRILYIMCHIPVFCWISATVLEKMLSEAESGEIPKTLTQMYTHFLIIQTNIKHEKDYEKKVKDEDMILKLGKLAFQQLVKRNLIFYEEDLRECGIDETEASVYSGLCTQIFREELGLYQGKVFCFVHLSIQEHLAALYVLLSFLLYKRDVLNESLSSKHSHEFTCHTISDLHQRAVDKALQSKNGHLDLFLRFLLGLSLESNQTLLKTLLTHVRNISYNEKKTIEYIKTRIRLNPLPEKSINLFHSLNELGDHSLVNEIQECLRSGSLSTTRLSSSQWSAVVFVLLTSECLDEFYLSKYISRENDQNHTSPDEVLQKLLPVVEASRSAELGNCNITAEGCAALASALRSNSLLRELNLSDNIIGGPGLTLLSDGLKDPHCKLEKLRLWGCYITAEGCAALASALRSNSHLRELDLTWNKIGDECLMLLSDGLKDPHCKLETLKLFDCNITAEGCAALASALRSNSLLRELDLTGNIIGGGGLTLLSDGLKDPHCKLEKLWLSQCNITDEGCAALASALRSNSHLRELNLSGNIIGDGGLTLLSDGLKDPHCKLEKLRLEDCNITAEGCAALASALRSNSHLRELDLTDNIIGGGGLTLLSDGLKDPHCKLEKLRLEDCNITAEGCAALASALRSNSHLRELDLTDNIIGGGGLTLLSDGLKDPHCKLEKLRLEDCNITAEGCAALASALRSNSHLRELDLTDNIIGGGGLTLLSDGLKDPHCKLEKLRLEDCNITAEGCAALASALRSNSHLRELDLTDNIIGGGGLTLLSDGLKDPHCKLEKLRLSYCNITAEGCAALASALRSNSHLRELDLTDNIIGGGGLTLLSDGLKDPHCKLEKLRLSYCNITAEGCAVLASALRSNSHLRELNLTDNIIGDGGLTLLSDGLKDPHCKLEKLRLSYCNITAEGCAVLASALRSNSHLRELNLTDNIIGDGGLTLLSDGLKDPHCKLEKLRLSCCNITAEGCAVLASALRSNSHLRELDLNGNIIGGGGLTLLSDGLKDPHCKLEKLRLWGCNITAKGCAALTSALRSNSHLRELDLTENEIGDASVKSLSALKDDPHYKLETLHCDLW
ncbi:NACHT, LRR and PYD domains-containing protein 12-like isoform X27 [Ctenopharyngodon idella]|uniref:NACHT, LRR and PYD domains-containing protein 12-like isoform X27 n=1 Tax=Ctenopharyngodon idella TaxID=7959 RepID=UPI002230FB3D|nr:NACHT, LRR and PYD domains-containing protein 12-like isoform X27 [Ctenopharyngodon idella]